MTDIIIIAIIAIIVGVAIAYIIKAKKSGAKCIGCPSGGNCTADSQAGGNNSCCCCSQGDTECHCTPKE